ncbi:MAG: winged helix-turn-helix domain-containing protein [Propionivibrio sp.]|uniref:Winged helix-turn-helix domain-containing protein n=1 Tax=Candidatus Propionivibrio dominans TaxID=2954373 RepID=A0A9D7FGM2_9RHOO|nr:winged helix-turn-helix domain-containing protein [Candidatus Propionivibrio dominans]MBL0167864.1 winged helix-turn-helix domain-containing protein [Propionivibrio sp.]
MARPRRIDSDLIGKAQEIAAVAKDLHTLRGAQAVLLPAMLNATLEQTAALLGVSRATVPRLQNALRRRCSQPDVAEPARGGRRHELMTLEEEREFLAPWADLARTGNMLVVSPLRAALSQKVGRTVRASVVYRLLERHGWRKVAPDTRHPKSDAKAQEDWKKNFPKTWRPSPNPTL